MPSSSRAFLKELDQKYYGAMVTHKCKEHEIKHFCKYHGRKAERKVDSTAEERTESSITPSQA